MSLIPHPRVARWETQTIGDLVNRHHPRYQVKWTALFFSPRTMMQGARVPVPFDVGLASGSDLDGIVSQYWVPYGDPSLLVYDLQVGRKTFHTMPGGRPFEGAYTIHYEDQKKDIAGPVNWPNWNGNVLVTKQNGGGEMMNVKARDIDRVLELVGLAIDGGLLT